MSGKGYIQQRFGILNHFGDVWTPETFHTAEEAQAYLEKERKGWGGDGLARHKVVAVTVTVTPISLEALSESKEAGTNG